MHVIFVLFAPMPFDDRPEPAKRLEAARVARGFLSARSAAEYFGWKYDTYVQHENGTRGIVRAAGKYAAAFRASEGWLLTGDGTPPSKISATSGLETSTAPIGSVKVGGKIAANSWMNVDEMDFGFDDVEYVPSVSGYPIEWQFALKIDGNCLNRVASHGDILVCLNTIAANVDVEPNDLVIVERTKFGGQMVFRTAKRVRLAANGFELWPESDDPRHQEPIKLYEATDGEEIRVMGKVLWILRKP